MCKASKTVSFECIMISTAYVHCTYTLSTASQQFGADTSIVIMIMMYLINVLYKASMFDVTIMG